MPDPSLIKVICINCSCDQTARQQIRQLCFRLGFGEFVESVAAPDTVSPKVQIISRARVSRVELLEFVNCYKILRHWKIPDGAQDYVLDRYALHFPMIAKIKRVERHLRFLLRSILNFVEKRDVLPTNYGYWFLGQNVSLVKFHHEVLIFEPFADSTLGDVNKIFSTKKVLVLGSIYNTSFANEEIGKIVHSRIANYLSEQGIHRSEVVFMPHPRSASGSEVEHAVDTLGWHCLRGSVAEEIVALNPSLDIFSIGSTTQLFALREGKPNKCFVVRLNDLCEVQGLEFFQDTLEQLGAESLRLTQRKNSLYLYCYRFTKCNTSEWVNFVSRLKTNFGRISIDFRSGKDKRYFCSLRKSQYGLVNLVACVNSLPENLSFRSLSEACLAANQANLSAHPQFNLRLWRLFPSPVKRYLIYGYLIFFSYRLITFFNSNKVSHVHLMEPCDFLYTAEICLLEFLCDQNKIQFSHVNQGVFLNEPELFHNLARINPDHRNPLPKCLALRNRFCELNVKYLESVAQYISRGRKGINAVELSFESPYALFLGSKTNHFRTYYCDREWCDSKLLRWLEIISSYIPVVYQPHPLMGSKPALFKQIEKIPNVAMVEGFVDTHELIRRSSFVVMHTSRSLVDALLLKTKVVVISKKPWLIDAEFTGITRIVNECEFPAKFSDLLLSQISDHDYFEFLTSLVKFDAGWLDSYENFIENFRKGSDVTTFESRANVFVKYIEENTA